MTINNNFSTDLPLNPTNNSYEQLNQTESSLSYERHKELIIDKLLSENVSFVNKINTNKSYFSIDEYNKISNSDELCIISLNINSLEKYQNNLNLFITELKIEPHIIILTEIRSNVECILNSQFPQYNNITKYAKNSKCGGVTILIKKFISFIHKPKIEIDISDIENIVIDIVFNKTQFTISAIYKHPKVKTKALINNIKSQLIKTGNTFILAGDINIDFYKYSENIENKNYFDSLI